MKNKILNIIDSTKKDEINVKSIPQISIAKMRSLIESRNGKDPKRIFLKFKALYDLEIAGFSNFIENRNFEDLQQRIPYINMIDHNDFIYKTSKHLNPLKLYDETDAYNATIEKYDYLL